MGGSQRLQRSQSNRSAPDSILELLVDALDDRSVDPYASHEHEVTLVLPIDSDLAHIDRPALGAHKLPRGHVESRGDADLTRPEVSGATRQHTDRRFTSEHTFHDLVQRAITPAADDHLAALLHGLARQLSRVSTM
jgi:hypothetical protein